MKLYSIGLLCGYLVFLTMSCQGVQPVGATATNSLHVATFGWPYSLPLSTNIYPVIPILPSYPVSSEISESSFYLVLIDSQIPGIAGSNIGETFSTNNYSHGYIVYDTINKAFYIGFTGGGFKENGWEFITKGFSSFLGTLDEFRKVIGIQRNENTDVVFVLSETPYDKELKCMQMNYSQFIITYKTIHGEEETIGPSLFQGKWLKMKASELFRRKPNERFGGCPLL